ncbi:glycosyltransferase family 2 protein [Aquicoccus sp. SU-CL01552]|uniref:glycosyltransferase family 2 protein n=1 Tax=Aquicoccus sp. SU-CL01552 TaxID=3127656 RepID=UPI0031081EC5
MTTFNDGELIRQSIASILNQSFEDFELIIVDDGSTQETKDILATFDDPRLQVLPQANDGLSGARNRGLQHVQGDYICFLDADDTRAPWSFAEAAGVIDATGAELILTRGAYSGERTELTPFFDEKHFDFITAEKVGSGSLPLSRRKAWAASLEPQSANKFVSRELVDRGHLRFPNDHFFEDILFHTMAVAWARSIEFVSSRHFTYFQRQIRPQLTASKGTIRFDVLGSVSVTLQIFENHPDFYNSEMRGALAISVLRLLRWCEEEIPAYHQLAYRTALKEVLRRVDPRFFIFDKKTPDPRGEREQLSRYAKEVMA